MSVEAADFYITGGTLRADAPSYVERDADRDLYRALSRAEFAYVLTSRQMGKSSLMVRTASRLRGDGVRVAVLDLTAIGLNLSPEQWYGGLLRRLARQLDPRRRLEDELDEYQLCHPELSPLQRFTDALEHVVLPRLQREAEATGTPAASCPNLVVFIDEIDVVRSLPFNTDEFFAAIRAFYNRREENPRLRGLAFCLLGVATPSDLIRDTRMTPFNIGTRVELRDFTPAEAAPLQRGLSAEAAQGSSLLSRVLHWTGGHPYLTQKLCHTIANEPCGPTPAAVDAVCQKLFLAAGAQDRDDNLLFVRERILHGTNDPAALLTTLMRVRRGQRVQASITDPVVEQLLLSGVVRAPLLRLEVRNRIYHLVFGPRWITEHMPDAEQRRQKAAYRKGLVRASAITSTITLGFAALAMYAWQQADLAQKSVHDKTLALQQAKASATDAKKQARIANEKRREADHANKLTTEALQKSQKAMLFAQGQRKVAERESNRAKDAEHKTQLAAAETRRLLYTANAHLMQKEAEAGNYDRVRQILLDTNDQPNRGFEWAFWQGRSHPEEARLVGHADAILAIAFAPDGHLLTGSADGTVRLWDHGTSRPLFTQFVAVTAAALNPEGNRILTGGSDGSLRSWNAKTGTLIARLPVHRGQITDLSASPDGTRFLSASEDGTVRIWNRATGQVQKVFQSDSGGIRAASWSRDGRRVLGASASGRLCTWNTESGERIGAARLAPTGLTALALSADGKTLAVGDAAGTIYLIDPEKPQEAQRISRHAAGITSLRFTRAGTLLSTSQDRTACLWSIPRGELVGEIRAHGSAVMAGAVAGDGVTVVTGDAEGIARRWRADSTVGFTRLETGRSVRGLAYSPDGKRLATACQDGSLGLWDTARGKEIRRMQGHRDWAASVAFDRSGTRLLSAGADEAVRVWGGLDGRRVSELDGHTGDVFTAVFSPDGAHCLSGSWDCTARLWDARRMRKEAVLTEAGAQLHTARFSPDARWVVTSRFDGIATIWKVAGEASKPVRHLEGHLGDVLDATFAPDSRTVATAGADGTVRLWPELGAGQPIILRGHTGPVRAVAFFHHRLATAGEDGMVKLWDPESGRECLSLNAEAGPLTAVAVSPDERHLAVAGERGVTIWNSAPPAATEAWVLRDRELRRQQEEAREQVRLLGEERLRQLLPKRAPNTSPKLIDLTPHYNALLNESWHDLARIPSNDLSEITPGQLNLLGTPFDVRGIVQLQYPQHGRDHRTYPPKVKGIRIEQKCRHLMFLHSASGGTSIIGDKTRIGAYRIHYADGEERVVPIIYGVHVRDWWQQEPVSASQVAWRGQNPVARDTHNYIQLYRTRWDNPRPAVPIRSLDFEFNGSVSTPFLLAITAE